MKHLRQLTPAWILLLMSALLICSGTAKQAAFDSLRLCATALIPSLLPFSVASNLFLLTGSDRPFARLLQKPLRLLHLPAEGCSAILTGLVGGYPVGLLTLAMACRQNRLSRREAVAVSRICNQAGPAFILGAVGLALFDSLRVGVLLWITQLLSALSTALFFAVLVPHERKHTFWPQQSESETSSDKTLFAALPEAVKRSSLSLLVVCAYVVFFGTVSGLLRALPLPQETSALLSAAMELCGGLYILPQAALQSRFIMISVLLAWGGVCVHLQGVTALHEAGLPARPYLYAKLLQAAFSLLLAVPISFCL